MPQTLMETEYDPILQQTEEWWYDDEKDAIIRRVYSHVQNALFDQNAAHQGANLGKKYGDMPLVASIPMDIFYRDVMPAIAQKDTKWLKEFLNNPDHRKFRTRGGKL